MNTAIEILADDILPQVLTPTKKRVNSLVGEIIQRSLSRKATASRKGHFLTIMTRSMGLKFFSHRKHRARLVLGLVAV